MPAPPRSAQPAPQLTTTQLADRTGVPAGTLRMWETRYGFPEPARREGGHRRYSERDVEQVRTVLRLRGEGLSLPSAVARARAELAVQPPSFFAGLRAQRPDLAPVVLSKRTLVELTWAIEDELCARAAAGVLIGSFQDDDFFRRSQHRWRDLARTARLAVVFAQFRKSRLDRSPYEVRIGPDHPLVREWAIVFSAPGVGACLAAWEIPSTGPRKDADRRFEVLWSPEPEVVRAAVGIASDVLADMAPELSEELAAVVDERPAVPTSPELRTAIALAHRMIAYLAAAEPA